MEYSDDVRSGLKSQFERLNENDREIFAAAEAIKFGERALDKVSKLLACDQSVIARGRRRLADRIVKRNIKAIEEIFSSTDGHYVDSWCDHTRGISHLVKEMKLRNSDLSSIGHLRSIGKHINSFRAILNRSEFWPTGVTRANTIARETFARLAPHIDIAGKSYLDLGCGNAQPFGTSAALYLNGAGSLTALDIDGTAPTRAAISLFDILADCIMFPDEWHWSAISREEFIERLYRFDLKALRVGDLAAGLKDVPIRYVVVDVADCNGLDGEIDAASSRVVLEHLLEFERANAKIFSMLKPGGVASHKIDLSDHRKKRGLHAFSFLAEEKWEGSTNRLRSSEIRATFDKIGFETLAYQERRQPMPSGFEGHLASKYRSMEKADLEVTEVQCVLRRPEGSVL